MPSIFLVATAVILLIKCIKCRDGWKFSDILYKDTPNTPSKTEENLEGVAGTIENATDLAGRVL